LRCTGLATAAALRGVGGSPPISFRRGAPLPSSLCLRGVYEPDQNGQQSFTSVATRSPNRCCAVTRINPGGTLFSRCCVFPVAGLGVLITRNPPALWFSDFPYSCVIFALQYDRYGRVPLPSRFLLSYFMYPADTRVSYCWPTCVLIGLCRTGLALGFWTRKLPPTLPSVLASRPFPFCLPLPPLPFPSSLFPHPPRFSFWPGRPSSVPQCGRTTVPSGRMDADTWAPQLPGSHSGVAQLRAP